VFTVKPDGYEECLVRSNVHPSEMINLASAEVSSMEATQEISQHVSQEEVEVDNLLHPVFESLKVMKQVKHYCLLVLQF